MQIGDQVESGIYAGDHDGHHIICSPTEYELPFVVNWYQATEYCKSVGMELPTKEELNLLCELYKSNPEYFPKSTFHCYWSSTERSHSSAWRQFLIDGDQWMNSKAYYYSYVRPIKRIKIDTRAET